MVEDGFGHLVVALLERGGEHLVERVGALGNALCVGGYMGQLGRAAEADALVAKLLEEGIAKGSLALAAQEEGIHGRIVVVPAPAPTCLALFLERSIETDIALNLLHARLGEVGHELPQVAAAEDGVHTTADVEVAAQCSIGLVDAVGGQEEGAIAIIHSEGAHGCDGSDEFHG